MRRDEQRDGQGAEQFVEAHGAARVRVDGVAGDGVLPPPSRHGHDGLAPATRGREADGPARGHGERPAPVERDRVLGGGPGDVERAVAGEQLGPVAAGAQHAGHDGQLGGGGVVEAGRVAGVEAVQQVGPGREVHGAAVVRVHEGGEGHLRALVDVGDAGGGELDELVAELDHQAGLGDAVRDGDRLIVGVSSDALNFSKKGRNPVFDQNERIEIISNLKVVAHVFLEESLELKRDYITSHAADVLVMGDDWTGKFDWVSDVCDVIYLPRTPSVSTTAIIEHIVTTRPAGGS